MIDALAYLFEFLVQEMMLPGQVENWIFIVDLKDMGLATLPFSVQHLLILPLTIESAP